MRHLRKHLALLFLLTAIALVPACGKRGPLYLPPSPTPPAQKAEQKPAQEPAPVAAPSTEPTTTPVPDATTK